MIFKLIEEKKLALEDRLSKFFPQFPNGDNITISHLLTHTSGINDYADLSEATPSAEVRAALFGRNKPNFAPGEGWAYCNGGYQLLGYIIEKITKMPYEEAIRRNIFNPLHMYNSGFDFKGLTKSEKTTAYHVFTDAWKQPAVLYDSMGPFSAGAIYSTVGDLYKYYKSFKAHQIISEASQAAAFSPSKTNEHYGHGWQLKTGFMKRSIVSHSGGAAGFRTNFTMIPDDDICIIILNNHENANPEYLTEKIIDILDGEPVTLTQEVKLKENQLQEFVGTFSITEPKMMIYTSIVDGRLAVQVSGQGKSVVLAKNESTFVQDEAHAILKFTRDNNGVYSFMEIEQGASAMKAVRVESSWGIIGNATERGWDDGKVDIKLLENADQKGMWVLKNVKLEVGEMKFRLNNDWTINYGDNKVDGILEEDGDNIKVKEAGVYDITLDLTDEKNPRYTALKK
jgi:CubicO group peptidase (beta-lactamase class C family)